MMHLFLLFAYTCGLAITLPLFFPSWRLFYFAPFLILVFYRRPLSNSLWWALVCGFIVDLLSSQTRLGTYSFNYCLTTTCLYRYQLHFFEDRLSTLPIMTFGFACLSTLIQMGFFISVGKEFLISWEWITSDLFWMPLQDALFAVVAFKFPFLIVSKTKWRSTLLFLIKENR